MAKNRIILHVDMDAFFAAIEERNNPHLRGKPIVVCTSTLFGVDPSQLKIETEESRAAYKSHNANHPELVALRISQGDPERLERVEGSRANPRNGQGRGVVSTANYEARKYGIRSAMPIAEAWRLCPTAVFLRPDFKLYEASAQNIRKILEGFNAPVEQVSIDEFYLDASRERTFEKAIARAKEIKKQIFERERLTCSVGIGPNKLVAKIASDRQKPDGLTVVPEYEVLKFLAPLPVRAIPGIGPKAETVLASRGITLVENLQKVAKDELRRWFGKWGEEMYEKARGHDDDPVAEGKETKSIGEQETFAYDTLKQSFIIERLMHLCESVWQSCAHQKRYPCAVVLTIRFADFETTSRSRTLRSPIRALSVFKSEALRLLLPFLDRRENPRRKMVRLIGIRGEKFVPSA